MRYACRANVATSTLVIMMTYSDNLTLRQRTLLKLENAMDRGIDTPFEPREAKLAGMFVEDAISLDDIDEEDLQEDH